VPLQTFPAATGLYRRYRPVAGWTFCYSSRRDPTGDPRGTETPGIPSSPGETDPGETDPETARPARDGRRGTGAAGLPADGPGGRQLEREPLSNTHTDLSPRYIPPPGAGGYIRGVV
jgi:hypothetical protein